MPNFRKLLRRLREDYHLTQAEAAEAFTMSLSSLQRTEAGQRELTYAELERVAEYCQMKVDAILRFNEANSPIKHSATPEREALEKIIIVQNEQISALLGEIRTVFILLTSLLRERERIRIRASFPVLKFIWCL